MTRYAILSACLILASCYVTTERVGKGEPPAAPAAPPPPPSSASSPPRTASPPTGPAADGASAPVSGSASTSGPQVAEAVPAVWQEGDKPGALHPLHPGSGSSPVIAYVVSRTGAQRKVWEGKMTDAADLQLPQTPFSIAGFYRFEIGGRTSIVATVVARPLTRVPGPPMFGVNTHFGQRAIADRAYGLLRTGNVDAIREQWPWGHVEKSAGSLTAPTTPNGGIAHQKAMLSQNNLKVLHNCAYSNGAYDHGQFPTSPQAIDAFANYCSFVAQQYGATLYGSEIWNEPNKVPIAQYAPLAVATASKLKATVPSTEIILGGGAGPGGGANPSYEEGAYHAAGSSCCTGHSIHPYMTNPDVGYFAPNAPLVNPVSGQSIVNMDFATYWSDRLSHSLNKTRGSHITEIGWYTVNDGGNGVSEEKQAAYVSRTLIRASKPSACTLRDVDTAKPIAKECTPSDTATTPDLKSIFIYDFQNDGTDAKLREQNFGLVTFDLAPKMGYSAFAQTAGVLRGSTFVKAFSFGRQSLANAYLYRVSANDGWLILWTSEYVPAGVMRASTDMNYQHEAFTRASVSVSGGGAQPIIAECREWDGQPCDKTSNSIVISTMPVFLRVHGPLQGIQVSGG